LSQVPCAVFADVGDVMAGQKTIPDGITASEPRAGRSSCADGFLTTRTRPIEDSPFEAMTGWYGTTPDTSPSPSSTSGDEMQARAAL
jgi:hypothetical protein